MIKSFSMIAEAIRGARRMQNDNRGTDGVPRTRSSAAQKPYRDLGPEARAQACPDVGAGQAAAASAVAVVAGAPAGCASALSAAADKTPGRAWAAEAVAPLADADSAGAAAS
jgi:hypothetical protein